MKRFVALWVVVAVAGACGSSTTETPAEASSSAASVSSPEYDAAIWYPASRMEMVEDPVGDSTPETSPFLDTVAYGVRWVGVSPGQGGTYLFRFEVAEPIPDSFEVPMDHDAAQYSFCLDTDPSTSPGGYPFASDEPVWCEFILTAVSEGGAWTGTLIDRRPLVTGGEAETPEITFLVDDANGLFAVTGDMLGSPTSFDWAMTASLLMLPLPSDDFTDLDANYEDMLTFQR
jgi:hypothetical protein